MGACAGNPAIRVNHDPERTLKDLSDIRDLLSVAGVDEAERLQTLPQPDPRSERTRSITIGEPFTLDS